MPTDNPYQSPQAEPSAATPDLAASRENWKEYSPEYNAAFKTALLLQAVLAMLTVLVLDSGQMHRAFWVAFLGQWAMVWIVLFRRPRCPTWLDLALVRYGIFPILIMVVGTKAWLLRMLD
jgi:hypothetical protein